jgi:hypothetical protein
MTASPNQQLWMRVAEWRLAGALPAGSEIVISQQKDALRIVIDRPPSNPDDACAVVLWKGTIIWSCCLMSETALNLAQFV